MNGIELDKSRLMMVLSALVQQVREDIPEKQGSRHLWDAMEDAEHLLSILT